MDTRQSYIDRLKQDLDKLELKIEELEGKAKETTSDVKTAVEDLYDQLTAKRDELTERLRLLRDATDDAWEYLKLGAYSAVDELKMAWKELTILKETSKNTPPEEKRP